jgi:hypothetical protein
MRNWQSQWLFENPFESRVPQIKRGVGEIKPRGKRSERQGIQQLMSRVAYPGKGVLVTYSRAKVFVYVRMKVLNQYNEGKWIFLGKLDTGDLDKRNYSSARFGVEVEPRIRDLVLKKTGKSPTGINKHGNTTGPDIVWEFRL